MSDPKGDLSRLSDDELVELYREMKTAGTGGDPRFVPLGGGRLNPLEEELESRGLAPDREEVIPTTDGDEDEPVVRDRA